MQRKNNLSAPATKKDLKLLGNDLKILEKSLRGELFRLEGKIETSDENAKKYKDEILTKLDEAMGEFGTIKEENIIGSGQTSQLREQAEDHEKRIKHLEKIQQVA